MFKLTTLKTLISRLTNACPKSAMASKRSHAELSQSTESSEEDVFVSEPIEDRSSTFVAYYSPTLAPKTLQKREEVKSASHRMLAWRTRSSSQRTLVGGKPSLETGCDDDGEKFGGKKVLNVLESCKAEGSLVVARWYGGVMLGPVRFTHIETCAREAVKAWQDHEQEVRRRAAERGAERIETERLVAELQERDASISSLRVLLDAKTDVEKRESVSKLPITPTRQMDYTALPLQRLRMLDKARDSTIAFLLKQLDAADKKDVDSNKANGKTDGP